MAFVNTKRGQLAFSASGSGSTVVALHGTASAGRQWTSLGEHVMRNHIVFAPDLPGHGNSVFMDAPGKSALQSDAEAVSSLITAWDEPVHLVGHSYGGAVALKIAQARPDKVLSLTLIEPAIFQLLGAGTPADQKLLDQMKSLAGIVNAAAACGCSESGMAQFIDFWHGPGAWAASSAQFRTRMTAMMPQAIRHLATIDDRDVTAETLASLEMPALLMAGLETRPVALRLTEMLAGTLPSARLVMVPDAGHMLPITDPHIVDPLIARHLAAVDAANASDTLLEIAA